MPKHEFLRPTIVDFFVQYLKWKVWPSTFTPCWQFPWYIFSEVCRADRNSVREAKEKKLFSGVLLFDLSTAYDVLDADILLKKVELYGLDQTKVAWLRSYLSERFQAVKVGSFIATPLPLPCGIPQGSAFFCLLFIIHVADIREWTQITLQGYADDTLSYCHGTSA